MGYIEFNPEPVWGQNSNGVNLVFQTLKEKDQSWLTQSNSSVCRWACPGGNGFFAALIEHLSEEDKQYLKDHEQSLQRITSAIAEFVKKDFDVSFSRTVEEEKTVTVDVPKVRKVGLFKKETYIDHETRREKYTVQKNDTYKGWRIERLYRKEVEPRFPADVMFLDYCLGADGKLYLVASQENNSDTDIKVFECICYSPAFLSSPFCNVYSAAISGVLGALDAIPVDQNDSLRNVHIKLDSDYYYNFPIQIDNGQAFTYGFLDGTIKRLVNLLDDSSKEACHRKYEWMGTFLFPDKQTEATRKTENAPSAQPSNNTSTAEPYDEKIDLELYAKIGAQFYGQYEGEIDLRLVSLLLQFKLPVAEKIAKEYPDFVPICEYIRANNNTSNLAGDFDEMFKAPDLFTESVDCAILMASLGTFLDRKNPDRTTSEACIVCVERVLNKPGKVVEGLHTIALLCVALWFSDYKGYKERVFEYIKKLVAENWYSDGTMIDLDEVRRSIDNSTFI